MLADLESLEKRVDNLTKKARGNDKEAREMLDLVMRSLELLREGKPARLIERKAEEERLFSQLGLLTSKPVVYVCNVDEASARDGNGFSRMVEVRAREEGAVAVVISAKIESEIATLSREERTEFLHTLGLEEAGLDRLIRAGYELLHLITFFTVGPKEARAWTVNRGTRAPQAAGAIHTDFERGFIRSETIAYDDYVTLGGEAAARDAGKLRLELTPVDHRLTIVGPAGYEHELAFPDSFQDQVAGGATVVPFFSLSATSPILSTPFSRTALITFTTSP